MRKISIAIIIGARPHFIKLAALLIALRKSNSLSDGYLLVPYVLHTGQHYDISLSQRFFTDFGIDAPAINLGVGSDSPGAQVGKMLTRIEQALASVRPNAVLVFGDTNSTLAGAIVAKQLKLPLFHVEAGVRHFDRSNIEELNRLMVDHIADVLLCPTLSTLNNCHNEGLRDRSLFVGDITFDFFMLHRDSMSRIAREKAAANIYPENFYLATIHRSENVQTEIKLKTILQGLGDIPLPVVCPLHPRTRARLSAIGAELPSNLRIVDPMGYFDLGAMTSRCEMVLTDSSGLQREAYFWKRPCVVIRDRSEWNETVESGWAIVSGADRDAIAKAIVAFRIRPPPESYQLYFGSGDAGLKIIREIIDADF